MSCFGFRWFVLERFLSCSAPGAFLAWIVVGSEPVCGYDSEPGVFVAIILALHLELDSGLRTGPDSSSDIPSSWSSRPIATRCERRPRSQQW
jgi:hypothetical protein